MPFSLIIGGTASGKSAYAESLAIKASPKPLYLATAKPLDKEMQAKITRHKKRRAENWRTVEEPLELVAQIKKLGSADVALIDCATLWLMNLLAAKRNEMQEIQTLCETINACPAEILIVTNDLSGGVIAASFETRDFQNTHGKMNQILAQNADIVMLVVAGLAQILKGKSP